MGKINKVLLIDDSRVVNSMNKRLLESMNIFNEVSKCTNPNEVLYNFENDDNNLNINNLPDIIFLDIEMPEMNAFEFLEKYRKIENIIKSDFKPFIVIVSDHLLENDNIEKSKYYSSLGVGEQILKPIDKEEVLSLIEEYL